MLKEECDCGSKQEICVVGLFDLATLLVEGVGNFITGQKKLTTVLLLTNAIS